MPTPQNPAYVSIAYEHGLRRQAESIAEKFGLPLDRANKSCFRLHLGSAGLELQDLTPAGPGPLFIDYGTGSADHRRRYGGGRNQPLGRAIGLKQRSSLSVVDATGGLGRDAFVLATMGCHVTLVERSAVFAALLDDALQRASLNTEIRDIIARMRLIHADSKQYLLKLDSENRPDVIYLDPMYPHRSKSALVKKEMRYARFLVGDDEDASELFRIALNVANYRVAVKRPAGADPLTGPPPHTVIGSKNTRYDIYINHQTAVK